MTDSSTFAPDWISPPGDTIEDLLEERSWTKAEFAERTGFTPKHINELVKGRVPITADAAERLSRVLGSTSDFWLVRDAQYQAACERQRAIKSAVEDAAWLSELPVSWMRKQGWVSARRDKGEQVLECLGYFGVASVDAWRAQYAAPVTAFRASEKHEKRIGALAAWLRRGEIETSKVECDAFDKFRLRDSLAAIRSLTTEPNPSVFMPRLVQICASNGVAIAFVPAPTGCPVSGATRWLTANKADLGAVLRALGVPDAIEHVGTPHFEGALARASDAARALEAAAPARDLAAAVRDFVGGVSYADRPGEREAALVAELAKIDDALAEVRQALQVAPGRAGTEVRADDPAGLLRLAAERLRGQVPAVQATEPDRTGSAPTLPACAGDEVDAREVRPGSVVLHEPTGYFGDTVTIRLTNGDGWHCEGIRLADGWDWDQCGFDRCREIATALTAKECAEVAALDAAGAVAWCGARAARLATEAVGEGLPRVVEWADLQPGDLALDADASVQLWRQDGKRSGSWRANNGTRVSGTRDGVDTSPDHVMSRRAILLARGVPKRASAISAAWEAIRSQAERLADQARKEGA